MKKPNLIYLKKQMFFLLCAIPEKDITKSEERLLTDLEEDVELQVELEYKHYMEGE